MFNLFGKKNQKSELEELLAQQDSRRKHLRFQRLFTLFIKRATDKDYIKVISNDLSEGGLSFLIPKEFELSVDDTIDLKIKLDNDNYILTKAVVRCIRPGLQKNNFAGVQFTSLPQNGRLEIREFIKNAITVQKEKGLPVEDGLRASIRKRISIPLYVSFSAQEGSVPVKSFDINLTGISFYYKGLASPYNTQGFDMQINIKPHGWIDIRAKVAHHRTEPNGEIFIGGNFVNPDKETLEIIKKHIY